MEFVSYDIESMDFRKAGAASRALKERLKLIGADAEAVRRTMIAAYEAEMNVVIHSVGGRLEASLSADQVDVDVVDRGPGIPDIDEAMTEGYSTAGAEARALGFGAGLGLPNIKKNSDRLRVTSRVDEGTRVSFTVELRPGATDGAHTVSLHASAELCRDCRACLAACPTNAMRVRDGRPSLLEHLCIDCGECIAACAFDALGVRDDISSLDDLADRENMTLVVPPALLAGCGPQYRPAVVWRALQELGFAEVVTSEPHEEALRAAVCDEAAGATTDGPGADAAAGDGARPMPVISPCCPAAVNLIELRFPSLVPHLAPLQSPLEAAQASRAGRPTAFVVSCPAQRSALMAAAEAGAAPHECLHPEVVRRAVLERLSRGPSPTTDAAADVASDAAGDAVTPSDLPLTVTGATHVTAVLEQIEDGLLTDVSVVEPYLCDGGCFGSPLLSEDHHVATRRWAQGRAAVHALMPRAESERRPTSLRPKPFTPRPGVRLDTDMGRAIEKLGRLQATIDLLPGKDCGACGAPTCAALAEDVIMQRAEIELCPYLGTIDKEVSDR